MVGNREALHIYAKQTRERKREIEIKRETKIDIKCNSISFACSITWNTEYEFGVYEMKSLWVLRWKAVLQTLLNVRRAFLYEMISNSESSNTANYYRERGGLYHRVLLASGETCFTKDKGGAELSTRYAQYSRYCSCIVNTVELFYPPDFMITWCVPVQLYIRKRQ